MDRGKGRLRDGSGLLRFGCYLLLLLSQKFAVTAFQAERRFSRISRHYENRVVAPSYQITDLSLAKDGHEFSKGTATEAKPIDEYDQFAQDFLIQLQEDDISPSKVVEGVDDTTSRVSSLRTQFPECELSPYYRRDRRDNCTETITDPEGLRLLLEKRYHCATERQQQRRSNDQSRDKSLDAWIRQIDRRLKYEYGVYVKERPPLWTKQPYQRRSEGLMDASTDSVTARRMADARMKALYGPAGHPFKPEDPSLQMSFQSDSKTLDLPTMHKLLSRRSYCRMEGLYDEADAIKFELMIHGILVNDDSRQWRFVSTAKPSDRSRSRPPISAPVSRTRARSTSAIARMVPDLSSTLQENDYTQNRPRVEQLVRYRWDALACGDFDTAYFLALELWCRYSVKVDDNLGTWMLLTGNEDYHVPEPTSCEAPEQRQHLSFPPILFAEQETSSPQNSTLGTIVHEEHQYHKSTKSMDPQSVKHYERILSLVQTRSILRSEGRFLEADAIRNELWATYNCGVNDRLRQYSIGGVYDNF